jgi:peptidoglycan hydrolase-like protein with peptidoglycan-binding domain
MKRIIKLTESDLNRLVSRILTEALDGDVEGFESAAEVRDAITNYDKGGVDAKERMKEIQRALKSKGYNLGRSGPNKDGVDGKYGQLTYNAIVDYQRKNGIKRTGWVGKLTSAKLGVEPMVSGTTFLGRPTGGGEVKPPVTTTDPKKQQQINNIYCSVKNGIIKNPDSTFNNTTWDSWVRRYKPTAAELAIAKSSCKKIQSNVSTPCVGLDPKVCAKISSTGTVDMGNAGTEECAQFVSNNLRKVYPSYFTGNAWEAYANVSGQGTGKYNIFKTGVDWNSIWEELKNNKITKSDCLAFYKNPDSDVVTIKRKSKKILDIAKNAVPESSSVDISSLKPGDVVGLWHKNTSNKGNAFCTRLIDALKLDDNGNFQKLPFSFNTHVGFVTAIKDGVPIIAHNVDGTYYTVPANKMLTKSSPDMIVWVASHKGVENAIAGGGKTQSKAV